MVSLANRCRTGNVNVGVIDLFPRRVLLSPETICMAIEYRIHSAIHCVYIKVQ